jgi:hypothetical protein
MVEESVSVDVKVTVDVLKTVLVYTVAVGRRLYDWGTQGSSARFSRPFKLAKIQGGVHEYQSHGQRGD